MEQHNNVSLETQEEEEEEEAPSLTTTSNTSSPQDIPTEINARHYKLILENDVQAFRDEVSDPSELLRTSDESTILHIVASMVGQPSEDMIMIDDIVQRSPTLLTRLDSKGDLPIHVAVRAGHVSVARNLIDLADQPYLENYDGRRMLEEENKEKNTALHIALENQQKDMASMLYEKCPNIINCKNMQGISPLYLAIKAGFGELVTKMIDRGSGDEVSRVSNDELPKHPLIHAVIMAQNKDILEKIIEKYPDELRHSIDEKGRRPLSYAAYIGFLDGVKCIINMKDKHDSTNYLYRNQAFKADNDGSFPIHSACCGGDIRVVEEMFSISLPIKMRWLLNKKGQNILHVAAESGKHTVVKYLLAHPNLVSMINMRDEEGYTPLHLGVLGKNPRVVYDLTCDKRTKLNLQCNKGFTALDIAEHSCGDVPSFEERLIWLALIYAGVPRAPQVQQSNDQEIAHVHNELVLHGKTTFIVNQKELQHVTNDPHKKHKHKERINTLLIISTLVATVTYASGFTVPGGYNNSNPKVGLATLDHKFAFQVFVISSTLAMHSSILAMVALIWAQLDDVRLALVSLDVALPLLGTALVTMSVAFMAGLYVVMHDLFWLRVVVLVMGGVFLGALMLLFMPLNSPMSCVKYKFMRRLFHVPFMLMLLACDKGKCNATLY